MRRFFNKLFLSLVVALVLVVGFFYGRQYVMRRIYPLEYKTAITAQADMYDLDPYFIAAIIWTESKFEPEAVSERGASGLMQIMPDTGAWIAEKIELTDYTPDMLFDAQTSIILGCWYLDYLESRFDGDKALVLAAYNAGPNRVADWLTSEEYSDGENLIAIPFPETEDYVERALNAYEIYQTYYTFETD